MSSFIQEVTCLYTTKQQSSVSNQVELLKNNFDRCINRVYNLPLNTGFAKLVPLCHLWPVHVPVAKAGLLAKTFSMECLVINRILLVVLTGV